MKTNIKKRKLPLTATQAMIIALCLIVLGVASIKFHWFTIVLKGPPPTTQTKSNLKVAIKGEKSASIKYSSNANLLLTMYRGGPASLYSLLFTTLSASDTILVNNDSTLLINLKDTMDFFVAPVLNSTVIDPIDIINEAIKNETLDYTQFIKDAIFERVDLATTLFRQDSIIKDKRLSLLRTAVSDPDRLWTEYYICPKCGNFYQNTGMPNSCITICHIDPGRFIHLHL